MTTTTLLENGMFPDGSNPEGVDPVPLLDWKSKADLTNVVVYGAGTSPPTCKIRAYLKYAGIPFEYTNVFSKPDSKYYTMHPVMDASGRQVNDSYVIVKNLASMVTGAYDDEWEERIVFQFQLSIEADCMENPVDYKIWLPTILPKLSRVIGCILVPMLRRAVTGNCARKLAKAPAKKVDITAFAKEFAGKMKGDFFAGAKPGQVDISFYGTLAAFVAPKVPMAQALIKDAGLEAWWARMEALIPLSDIVF